VLVMNRCGCISCSCLHGLMLCGCLAIKACAVWRDGTFDAAHARDNTGCQWERLTLCDPWWAVVDMSCWRWLLTCIDSWFGICC
jgi:hypothetical protein